MTESMWRVRVGGLGTRVSGTSGVGGFGARWSTRGQWYAQRLVDWFGWLGWLVGPGDRPIDLSPRVMNCVYNIFHYNLQFGGQAPFL
jgi:hypothetical protein